MRRRDGLSLVLVASCGRVAFDPTDARTGDGGASDTTDSEIDPGFVRYPMEDNPFISEMMFAVPASFTVPCNPCPSATPEHIVGGTAYAFDGTTRVELAANVLPASGPYTITVWLAADTNTVFASALSKPYDLIGAANDISLTVSAAEWAYEGTHDGVNPDSAIDTTNVRAAWHHFALVFDGVNRSIYLDATIKITTTNVPWLTSTLPIAVGGDLDNGTFNIGYTGGMDDLRFYPRALSPGEISTVFGER